MLHPSFSLAPGNFRKDKDIFHGTVLIRTELISVEGSALDTL